jgi:uncharacterized membrane protein
MTPATSAKRQLNPAVKPAGKMRRRTTTAKASASPIEDAIQERRRKEGRKGLYDDEMLAIAKERLASGDFITMEEFRGQLSDGD